jgi:hypothetical protein
MAILGTSERPGENSANVRSCDLDIGTGDEAMQCRSCHSRLEYADNYCRKCGTAVDIVEVEVVRASASREVSALRAAALPVVAQGTAMIAAGAILRFALRQLLTRHQTPVRGLNPFSRGSTIEAGEVEELLYYRRTRAR